MIERDVLPSIPIQAKAIVRQTGVVLIAAPGFESPVSAGLGTANPVKGRRLLGGLWGYSLARCCY